MNSLKTGLSRRDCLRWGTGLVLAGLAPGARGELPSPAPTDIPVQGFVPAARPGELLREFVYESAPFPSCHASTIAETQSGLITAWFGGTAEGNRDVCIYVSRRHDDGWSVPRQVANGYVEREDRTYPCWNPVLYLMRDGMLYLFYKVGPKPHSWWGMVRSSTDQGRTWSAPRKLPPGYLGPVRAKPVQLHDGTLLCGSSTEHAGWQVQMETTRNPFHNWSRTRPLNRGDEWGAIQPTILLHNADKVQILCRSRQRVILESWSGDGGETWSPLSRTRLPNPSAGIDAVKLADGRFLLVYNHAEQGRGRLNVALSPDGRQWEAAHVLEDEDGEFSYPAAILTRDRRVHITYTWNRRKVRHVVLDPGQLVTRPFVDGAWPG